MGSKAEHLKAHGSGQEQAGGEGRVQRVPGEGERGEGREAGEGEGSSHLLLCKFET